MIAPRVTEAGTGPVAGSFAPLRSDGSRLVDQITRAQMATFADEYGILHHPEDAQFEHYAAFAAVRRHYDRTFIPADVVIGSGGDTGIDAIAIIVNNVLIDDVDMVKELADQNGFIEATFIFIQAERSSSFDGSKILNLIAGISDFFSDNRV